MGSKLKPGNFDCYSAALPDEEMFVLLARDQSAPDMLRIWAKTRRMLVLDRLDEPDITPADREAALEDLRKCTEADACADNMVAWRKRNEGAWRRGQERRVARTDPTADHMANVAAAAIKGVAAMAGIQANFLTSLEVTAHTCAPWASPSFNGARHRVIVRTPPGRLAGCCGQEPEADAMPMTGQLVADVTVLAMTEDEIHLNILTVYEG